MTNGITFNNQDLGSFGSDAAEHEKHEYVQVWYDETKIAALDFHCIMLNGARVFGVKVDIRFGFQFCKMAHTTTHSAIAPDGSKLFVTQTWSRDGKTEEFHLGDKFGPVVARMIKTGYIQQERR